MSNSLKKYSFSVIRGIQSGNYYYTGMCSMETIVKKFLFKSESIEKENSHKRVLQKSSVQKIAKYVVSNPETYVISAISVSVDAQVTFEPITKNDPQCNLGLLHIPISARFLVIDGQHRQAAFEIALKQNPELLKETVPVLFFQDVGLQNSQRLSFDLTRSVIHKTRSRPVLNDSTDEITRLAKLISARCQTFEGIIEFDKSSLSRRSPNLFTSSALTKAVCYFFSGDNVLKPLEQYDLCFAFWNAIGRLFPEWQLVQNRLMTACDVREKYVHSHGVVLKSFGRLGAHLTKRYPNTWARKLRCLKTLDWHRSNLDVWGGRLINDGRISISNRTIALVVNVMKHHIGIPLSLKETKMEEDLMAKRSSR